MRGKRESIYWLSKQVSSIISAATTTTNTIHYKQTSEVTPLISLWLNILNATLMLLNAPSTAVNEYSMSCNLSGIRLNRDIDPLQRQFMVAHLPRTLRSVVPTRCTSPVHVWLQRNKPVQGPLGSTRNRRLNDWIFCSTVSPFTPLRGKWQLSVATVLIHFAFRRL